MKILKLPPELPRRCWNFNNFHEVLLYLSKVPFKTEFWSSNFSKQDLKNTWKLFLRQKKCYSCWNLQIGSLILLFSFTPHFIHVGWNSKCGRKICSKILNIFSFVMAWWNFKYPNKPLSRYFTQDYFYLPPAESNLE